jgi:hypothetical protein
MPKWAEEESITSSARTPPGRLTEPQTNPRVVPAARMTSRRVVFIAITLVVIVFALSVAAVEGPRPVPLSQLQLEQPAAAAAPGGIMGFISSYWHLLLAGFFVFRMLG